MKISLRSIIVFVTIEAMFYGWSFGLPSHLMHDRHRNFGRLPASGEEILARFLLGTMALVILWVPVSLVASSLCAAMRRR
jgi:hypothetical protein